MANVKLTINGITVECDVSEIESVTAALSGVRAAINFDDGGDLRPGERRRENPSSAAQQDRAAEFRRIREAHTSIPIETQVGRKVPKDSRKRSPSAGER